VIEQYTSQQLRDAASESEKRVSIGGNPLNWERIVRLEETLHHEREYHAKQIAALKTELGRVKRQLDIQTERAIRAEEQIK
jgi:hypothetical protein